MADSASSGPQPSASAGAPGYDGGNQGQQQQHMPPPLAPVIIPQNNNPIPTAISSPMSANVMSPTSGGPGYVPRRAAPEPNKRALYVGGLDPRVTEDVLRQIFETTGHVQSVKIIPDKNASVRFCSSPTDHQLRFMFTMCHPMRSLVSSTPQIPPHVEFLLISEP